MIFSSMIFLWIFLPICLFGNFLLHKLLKKNSLTNIFLLLLSIIFYTWGEPVYIFLMLFSIFINWGFGLGIAKYASFRKLILVFAVIINLSILGYYKYVGMLIEIANMILNTEISVPKISLPIGISFFTFQALSYVIDVFRNECNVQHNPLKLGLYISFFPQLIAGPIIKYKDINEQIEHRSLSLNQTAAGIRRFCYGLAKKVLISNVLAHCVDSLYTLDVNQVTCTIAWITSIMYTFQIYYDFSGYSDMTIGLGKMLGFYFNENFNYPYTSLSIREFWQRWHISLGSWFKEYVYIPLGGNKKGSIQTYINLGIVFILTGIWHGADLSFLFWGIYHGFFNILERLGLAQLLKKNKYISWVYTFITVNIGWIFFRTENVTLSLQYIIKMLTPWHHLHSTISIWKYINKYNIFILFCAILGMGFIQRFANHKIILNKWKYSLLESFYCIFILLLSIFSLASNTYNPFIYFRF